MVWSITDPRAAKDIAIAAAPQTAYGTPAGTTSYRRFQVTRHGFRPGHEYENPRGTTGSHFAKATHTKVAERPSATLECMASPASLAFWAEWAMGGLTIATQAAGDITEANDGGAALSLWTASGVRLGFNTAANGKWYVTLTDETPGAAQAQVSVYKDSGRTQLVAQGNAANNNTVSLTAQNSSGLTMTVALAAPSATDSDIELTVVSVRPQFSGVLARFFTLWRDHGSGQALERLSDCAVTKMRRFSTEGGLVKLSLDIVASTYTYTDNGGGVISAALTDAEAEWYQHGTLTFNSDVDSGNVAQAIRRLEWSIENELEVILANSATASKIAKTSTKMLGLEFTQRHSDEAEVILGRGLSGTFEAVKVVDDYGGRSCTVDFDKAKSVEPTFPDGGEDGFEDLTSRLEAFEEVASTPTAPMSVVIEL